MSYEAKSYNISAPYPMEEGNGQQHQNETAEEKRVRLDGEILELMGEVEQRQYDFEALDAQAQITARNARELFSRGGFGSHVTSGSLDKSANARRRLGDAQSRLDQKRKELFEVTGWPTIPVEEYTWDEWWWSWLGYKPERRYLN